MGYLVVCNYMGNGVVGTPVGIYRKRNLRNLLIDYPGAVDYEGDDKATVGGWVYFELDEAD